jgi:nickel/cobalt transporter (NicO) family protein
MIGLGVAGGLVPSPTALLVLLGAVGFGRTLFGVGLVLAYGVGMAATLTAAGLLLVKVRSRWLDRPNRLLTRVRTALPLTTSGLILLVGIGMAVRATATIL